MEVSDKRIKELAKRIMISRMRILCNNGFYGLLLMHMKISISDEHETAWTDCKERIWFNPEFVDRLTDTELDYVLMHEIVHVALRHIARKGSFDRDIYNVAADIVTNSNILLSNDSDENSISLKNFGGVQMHTAPNGEEGYKYSVEELYHILFVRANAKDNGNDKVGIGSVTCDEKSKGGVSGNIRKVVGWDIHIEDKSSEYEDELDSSKWEANIRKACEVISKRNSSKRRGLLPAFAQRYISELNKSQTDWRQLINEFVQDEINDYSFSPPDRRMDDNPFFLPDFSDRDYRPGKILFMIDTSGSMSNQEITDCYSEINGALLQFNGKLEGMLGFFDAVVIEPIEFEDIDELMIIRPKGGGGTSFHCIFNYVRENMMDDLPESIVILTDGYAPFPDEEVAMGIPVLWIINNEKITPPWGVVARIKSNLLK